METAEQREHGVWFKVRMETEEGAVQQPDRACYCSRCWRYSGEPERQGPTLQELTFQWLGGWRAGERGAEGQKTRRSQVAAKAMQRV